MTRVICVIFNCATCESFYKIVLITQEGAICYVLSCLINSALLT